MVRFKFNPDAPPQLTLAEKARLDAMTDAEITAAAESDPDNPPLTKREMTAFRIAHLIKSVRTARNLSQRQFASLYGIPIGNVRDWEQGRSIPDKAAQSYLAVIRKAPELVVRVLERD